MEFIPDRKIRILAFIIVLKIFKYLLFLFTKKDNKINYRFPNNMLYEFLLE